MFRLFIFSLLYCTLNFALSAKYTCKKCVTDKSECGNDVTEIHDCDFCMKVDGYVYDVSLIPEDAKTFLKENFPSFDLSNGQHAFGRGCVSKEKLQELVVNLKVKNIVKTGSSDDSGGCTISSQKDKNGFVGTSCACAGNCS